MSNKTRKYIWPVSLAMSLALLGALAAIVAFGTVGPQPALAHGPCSDLLSADPTISELEAFADCVDDEGDETHTHNGNGDDPPAGTMLKSSSTSGGASVKLTLTIVDLPNDLNSGSWVEIYLEDDYQEPDSISRQDVVFIATNADGMGTRATNDGGTVTAAAVEIDDGGEIGDEDDAVVISARIPDMDPRDDSFGYPEQGQTLMMIVASSAEIKNPTEATSNSTGYAIVGAGEDRGKVADFKLTDLPVKAKIALSADDGGRGKEVTISGSGFNDGTEAEAFVLSKVEIAEWWESLDCDGMKAVMGSDSNRFCFQLNKMTGDLNDPVAGHDDFKALSSSMQASYVDMVRCRGVINEGQSLGTANVGSDDKFSIVFTVHQDEFDPGEVNYICAADNESPSNRLASAVKVFDVTPSLTISPDSASSGEEVTLKPRDFSSGMIEVSLDGDEDATYPAATDDDFVLTPDGTSDYVFDMPGGLSGVVQVSFKQGDDTKHGTITVDPSNLKLSKAEVAPNETVIISGSGFSEGKTINVNDIKLDGKSMVVDNAGTEACGDDDRCVKTTSSGEFTTTVSVLGHGRQQPGVGRRHLHHQGYRLRGFRGQGQDNHPGAHGVGDAGDGESAGLHHHQRRELAHQHG